MIPERQRTLGEIVVNRSEFPLPEYVFLEPILTRIPTRSYEGKSLEDIEKDYGADVAQNVYWMAAHGHDLTAIHPPTCETRDLVTVRVDESDSGMEVFLAANDRTEADEDYLVGRVIWPGLVTEDTRRNVLKRFLRQVAPQGRGRVREL